MYYIYEFEMPEDCKLQLEDIAGKNGMALQEMTNLGMMYIISYPEDVLRWQSEYESLPLEKRLELDQIRFVRCYPVKDGETVAVHRFPGAGRLDAPHYQRLHRRLEAIPPFHPEGILEQI